jgi:flagellin-specific chaperone FliS
MSKEFEIGIGLLKKIYTELQALSTAEDKRQVKELMQAIINPLVAGAYQIKVGDGPQKDKLLEILFPLIRELRDMQNLESIRTLASELVNALDAIEAEVATQEGSSG